MKKLLKISLTVIIFSLPFISKAQCGFDIVRTNLQQNPNYLIQEKEMEKQLQLRIKNGLYNKVGGVDTVPVVVHILHLGEPIGTGTNITDAQIQSGIDRLNIVYRGLDPNSPIDLGVEFVLAKRDPNCNATSGINRVDASGVLNYTASGVFLQSIGADENTLKDLSRWPETDYLNIWIVTEIDGNNGGSGIQGYANFFNGNAYEGSVMMYTVFGYDPANAQPSWPLSFSRDNSTPIHEFGHYFHLYHTFQGDDSNNDGIADRCPNDIGVGTQSDGCADTEIHKRHTSTCPANNDCNGNAPYNSNTLHNYMSYFDCTNLFTNDQKTRISAVLSTASVTKSKGAIAPGAPFNPPLANSCTPQTDPAFGLAGNYSGIGNVTIKDMISSSGYPATDNPITGTLDQSGNCQKLITVALSEVVPISVTTLFNNGNNIKAYVDYNNNGIFDVTEEIFNKTGIAASSTTSGTFTIPPSATTGNSLRLRVIQDLSLTITGPCYNPKYGQAEDYTIYIQPASGNAPIANFSGTPTTICEGSSVSFTDLSTNTPTSWSWTFGDGGTSTSQNPSHIYSTAGTYDVTLTATNAFGNDTKTKVGYITVNGVPGNAGAITGSASECENATGIAYSISAVTGATNYTWTVPTGATIASGSSTTNITVNFGTANGNVAVTPSNSCGNGGNSSKAVTINVCGSAPVADFSGTTTICKGSSVSFTDLSTNTPTSWSWTFGDGGTSTSQNPSHIYSTAGTYDVTLTATNAFGNDTKTKVGYVTVNACGTTQLRSSDCGLVMTTYLNYILCNYVAGATQYEYEFVNSGLVYTQTVLRTNSSYRFIYVNEVPGIQNGTTYDVRVRAKVGGTFGNYGPICQLTTPANSITTHLRPSDCGLTMTSYLNYIMCEYVNTATEYEYEFVNTGLGYNQTVLRTPAYKFVYVNNVPGIQNGTTYDVRVRAKINGVFTSYGNICQITTPGTPITTQLISSDCGITMTSYSNYITCDYVNSATQYEYEFVNTGLGYSQTILRTNPTYKFVYVSDVSGIQNSTTYDVRVRAKINGVFTSYGSVCQITTPANSITTQLISSDCGITMTSYSNYITCDYVNSATQYEYEFVNSGLGYNQTVLRTNPSYRFIYVNDVPGIQLSTTYDVRVRAKINGTFTNYGTTCQVTTPATARLTNPFVEESKVVDNVYTNNLNMKMYPNPSQGEFVYLELKGLSPHTQLIVTDIFGKTVLNQTINSDYGNYNGTLRFDKKLNAGFYLITVISGNQKTTKKLIVQ